MQYREFGKTGVKISALGFGGMRLPMENIDGRSRVKDEEAIGIIHRAFELGVNYIDTAFGYCAGQSEIVIGKALKGWRDKVYLSTKMPTWNVKGTGDYRKLLEKQLSKLDVDYIDFYHFHGLSKDNYENIVLKYNLLDEAIKAKEEGLIKHISFSFHDEVKVLKELVDTGIFESVLCQYNLLDRSNEEGIAYAKEKGLGVVIMGPVGGGRLGFPSESLQKMVSGGVKTTAEIALRFVLANQNVSCALSGMSTLEMVEENTAVASRDDVLSQAELEQINAALEENQRLADLYCTGCDYCMPCPNGVKIPYSFKLMNYHRVYNLTDYAREEYKNMKEEERAANCIECGACEKKCPQKIEIRKQLKETANILG